MRIDEAILIMENERPHCGDKLTFTEEERYEAYTWAIGALKELSSAQPGTARRIVGKSRDGITLWYQCDMCNEPVDAQDNFCSGCGRRLTDTVRNADKR